jgi:hypothetical protein
MTLTRMAVVLAVAGFATKLYLDALRRQTPQGGDGGDEATVEPGAPAGGTVARAVSGADSPNDAERLNERGFAETLPGVAGAGMFGSNSQLGSEPSAPGLPDFARGA